MLRILQADVPIALYKDFHADRIQAHLHTNDGLLHLPSSAQSSLKPSFALCLPGATFFVYQSVCSRFSEHNDVTVP